MSENKKQDFDDYNNEIAGLDTGRIRRFLSKEARDHLEEGKNGKSQEKLSFLDILLMTDPTYVQLYSDVMDKIKEIDIAMAKALAQTEQQIGHLQTNLADIKERAQRLADGTLIYRSQDGTVFSDDGLLVPQNELGGVKWQASNPSWEERRATGETLDSAHEKKEEIVNYRDGTFQNAKDRMNDRDNPPDKDELQEILNDLETFPGVVEAKIEETHDKSAPSSFMTAFKSKAFDQDANQDAALPQIQQKTQDIEDSTYNPVITP